MDYWSDFIIKNFMIKWEDVEFSFLKGEQYQFLENVLCYIGCMFFMVIDGKNVW